MPDREIADMLGVCVNTVGRARRQRGIVRHGRRYQSCSGVDWDKQPLGKMTDKALADRLGVSPSYVWHQRSRRGIAPCVERKIVNWDEQPLGLVSDTWLAEQLGMDQSTVTYQRHKRNIPPCRQPTIRRLERKEMVDQDKYERLEAAIYWSD